MAPLLLCCAGPALAGVDALEAAFAADRQTAQAVLRQATAAAEQARAVSAGRVAALEASATATRADLAALQKQLLGVLAKDDAAAIRATRAILSARQAELDADEGDAALLLKQVEELERDRDAWKKRIATLELALRMDLRAMLAGPAEIDDRDKRVDAAAKEIDAQHAQIRKCLSRRDAAAARRDILLRRLAALPAAGDATSELRRARDAEARQVRRLVSQQEEWFRLNRRLEERARRNLAFASTELLVSRHYADALARKAHAGRAGELLALADRCESQLALLRARLPARQQAVATNFAAATAQADAAQQAIGEARTAPEEELARAAYAGAQARKGRWEAEADCWKEFLSLQKAGAAFARELADRARSLSEERSIADINQEEEQLRASLATSGQYVRSFELLLQKTDAQIEAAPCELALAPPARSNLAAAVSAVFESFDASRPPAAALLADLLRAQADRLPDGDPAAHISAERRRDAGALLLARLAQREMLRVRQGIAERWLENSRNAMGTLEMLAGHQLWQQHDPRLNAVTVQETLALAGHVLHSADFTLDCWRQKINGGPGVPERSRVLAGALLTILLGVTGWLLARLLRSGTRAGRFGRKVAPRLLPLAGAAWMAFTAGPENLMLRGLAWVLLLLAGWCLSRNLLLTLTRDHQAPPSSTAGGAFLAAFDTTILWTVVILPFERLAASAANAWDTQAVLARIWIFGLCLALFRLAMHPSLAGRFLSRRSENRLLRALGSFAAIACVCVAALVAITYLSGLDNLGRSALHAAEGTFAILAGVLAATAILGTLARREEARSAMAVLLLRLAQIAALLAAAAAAGWIWWLLLNRAVLASNAPPPVPELAAAAGRGLQALLRVWHAQLTAGMTVASLARGLLVFAASFWVSRQARRVLLQRVLARTPMDDATRQTFANVLGYVVVVLGFLVGLNVAGSSLQNLALLAGAITVGVGFGLQNVINNFVSSLMIHFGRTIRVGDYIDVGGTRGTVREIGMRNTVLQTDDEITVLVPNGSFITANIVNWTNPSRRTRLHVPVLVTRQADLTAVAELAAATAGRHALILKNPAPVLEVRSVTAAQVTLDLQIWSERPEKAASIVGDISLALDQALREKEVAV
ncbi:MAG: mechanosensitive ion channel domain-containing protein [bacterium]